MEVELSTGFHARGFLMIGNPRAAPMFPPSSWGEDGHAHLLLGPPITQTGRWDACGSGAWEGSPPRPTPGAAPCLCWPAARAHLCRSLGSAEASAPLGLMATQ